MSGTPSEYAATTVASNNENLWIYDNLASGDRNWIVAGWLQYTSGWFYSEYIGSQQAWSVYRGGPGVQADIYWSNGGNTRISGIPGTGVTSSSDWFHVLLSFNQSTRNFRLYTQGIFRSSSTGVWPGETQLAGTLSAWTKAFDDPPSSSSDAGFCAWGFWHPSSMYSDSDLLSMASYLYNSGNELYYSELSGTDAHVSDLSHFYNFNEYSDGTFAVQRDDSVGTSHLTDTNTCASTTSVPSNP